MEACIKGESTGRQQYFCGFLHVFVLFYHCQDIVQYENIGLHIPVRQYLFYYIFMYGYPELFWQRSKH